MNNQEKEKKLIIKTGLNLVREYLNQQGIGLITMNTCVSIKPGGPNKHVSLQSYPNANVWESLSQLPSDISEKLISFLIEKVNQNQQQYSQSVLNAFLLSIQDGFNFKKFYQNKQEDDKEKEQLNQETQSISSQKTNKKRKWKKDQHFISETKSILIQMQLCNKNHLNIEIKSSYIMKLSSLIIKIKEQKHKLSDDVIKFLKELQKFCQYYENEKLQKKVKIEQTQQNEEIKQETQQETQQFQCQEEFLNQIAQEAVKIEPNLIYFLPKKKENNTEYNNAINEIMNDYYRELYYKKVVGKQQNLSAQLILKTWKEEFDPKIQIIKCYPQFQSQQKNEDSKQYHFLLNFLQQQIK